MGRKSGKTSSVKRQENERKVDTPVWIAIITSVTTLLVALLAFPPMITLFEKDPTPTFAPTSTIPVITDTTTETNTPASTSTEILPPTVTDTHTSTVTVTATDTATPTITITSTATPNVIDVQLIASSTSGKSPLTVDFDARGSFLRESDGNILNCGICNYTWYVYQNSQLINEPQRSSDGIFRYRFGNRGEYRVAVKVCRGKGEISCGVDAEDISVR